MKIWRTKRSSAIRIVVRRNTDALVGGGRWEDGRNGERNNYARTVQDVVIAAAATAATAVRTFYCEVLS